VRAVVRLLSIPGILLLLMLPVQSQEQPPILVTSTSIDYAFGQQATFHIEASADSGITALYLYVQKEGSPRIEVIPVPFEGGSQIQASGKLDLRHHSFPPFGDVSWWWEVHDGSDHRLTTEPSTFQYVDNRFQWHAASTGPVRLHTVVDDPVYVQAALDVAQNSLARLTETLQNPALSELEIYIYPSLADLRAALEMGGREWMGGQARPELGVVLVAIPHDDEFVAAMEQDIPHELAHLAIYRSTGPEGYTYVPAWLNEGLAMASQLRPNANLDVLLAQARAEGRLIPLLDLCAPFPSDPETALLSYAQSASLVRYIRDWYGSAAIRALLDAYGDGLSCEAGIHHALDTSPERLELGWRAHLMGLSRWSIWLGDNAPWLLLWGLSLILTLPMAGGFRRRQGADERQTAARDEQITRF